MAISLSSDITQVMNTLNQKNASEAKATSLQQSLKNLDKNATDEELMAACKSFESYLVEQVLNKTREALIPEKEDENEYLKMFGDKLYTEYATMISDSGQLGLAQKLYEAMKRDYKTTAAENT